MPSWRTRDGRTIDVKDMSEQHIRNTIAYLKRRVLGLVLSYQDKAISDRDFIDQYDAFDELIGLFERELCRRSVI